jgi:hypothetical protein
MNSKKSKKDIERLEILVALALDETLRNHGDVEACSLLPCPEHEELVAWHEGNLREDRRLEILNHLGECEKCYNLWGSFSN